MHNNVGAQRGAMFGFTLIEILIALTISSIVVAAALNIWVRWQRTEMVLQQQRLRSDALDSAEYMLRLDVLRAGGFGCFAAAMPGALRVHINNPALAALQSGHFLQIFADHLWAAGSTATWPLRRAIVTGGNIIHTDPSADIAVGSALAVADCMGGELVTVQRLQKSADELIIYLSQPLQANYAPNMSSISTVYVHEYYVAADQPAGVLSLWQQDVLQNHAEAVVAAIEAVKFIHMGDYLQYEIYSQSKLQPENRNYASKIRQGIWQLRNK